MNCKEAKSLTAALTCYIPMGRQIHHSQEATGVGCVDIVIRLHAPKNRWVNFPNKNLLEKIQDA